MSPSRARRATIYLPQQPRQGGHRPRRPTPPRRCEGRRARPRWTVVVTHTENDVSAYSGKSGKGYRALLADLEAGRVDGVLVRHTDRPHRSLAELGA